jgi:NAD(P)-dependent dehydrogenase (short-subunit alcohol dehydrogenase family)
MVVPLGSWRLDGQVAVITGSLRGIGFACAEAFLAAGATVACVDRPGSGLPESVSRLPERVSVHEVDLLDLDRVERLPRDVIAEHGALDILVNAAGVLFPRSFLEMDRQEWEATFGVNARGSTFLAQACARSFVERGVAGRMILFASIAGRSIVRLNNTAYAASKAALIQAARCMALELAPHGITVNTISPGSTATEMLVEVQARGDVESVIRGNAAEWRLGIPLGRLADPGDQAALAVFLAGAGARHITGQDLVVDGGQTTV